MGRYQRAVAGNRKVNRNKPWSGSNMVCLELGVEITLTVINRIEERGKDRESGTKTEKRRRRE